MKGLVDENQVNIDIQIVSAGDTSLHIASMDIFVNC
jgi:hypothetical protein